MKKDRVLTVAGKPGPERVTWSLKTVKDRCDEVGSCWIWKQCCVNGYPQATINGKGGTMVRRWVWMHTHGGRFPNGGRWMVVSDCESRLCCNPGHLKLAKHSTVMSMSWASGARNRSAHALFHRDRMIANGGAKLTMEKARAIRADKRVAEEVAAEYGVCVSHVYDIRRGRAWKENARVASVFTWGGAA